MTAQPGQELVPYTSKRPITVKYTPVTISTEAWPDIYDTAPQACRTKMQDNIAYMHEHNLFAALALVPDTEDYSRLLREEMATVVDEIEVFLGDSKTFGNAGVLATGDHIDIIRQQLKDNSFNCVLLLFFLHLSLPVLYNRISHNIEMLFSKDTKLCHRMHDRLRDTNIYVKKASHVLGTIPYSTASSAPSNLDIKEARRRKLIGPDEHYRTFNVAELCNAFIISSMHFGATGGELCWPVTRFLYNAPRETVEHLYAIAGKDNEDISNMVVFLNESVSTVERVEHVYV